MLKDILQKLADKEAEAAIIPESVDPRVRAGVEAVVRNAVADIETIKRQYKEAVMDSVVVINVSGEHSDEFVSLAENLGALAVDFNFITTKIVNALKDQRIGELYNSNAHFAVLGELSRIRLEYDIVQLPTPLANNYNDGIYDQPIEIAVSRLLEKNYGTSLQSAVTRRIIGQKALDSRFSGKKLPVVIYNVNGKVDTRFISDPFTTIEADSTPTESNVKKKLTEVKSLLTKSQNNGQNAQTQEEEHGQ